MESTLMPFKSSAKEKALPSFIAPKKGRPVGSGLTKDRTEKKCSCCKEIKTMDHYYLDPTRPDNRDKYCVPCHLKLQKVRRDKRKALKCQA
jgi:hypothetical protein